MCGTVTLNLQDLPAMPSPEKDEPRRRKTRCRVEARLLRSLIIPVTPFKSATPVYVSATTTPSRNESEHLLGNRMVAASETRKAGQNAQPCLCMSTAERETGLEPATLCPESAAARIFLTGSSQHATIALPGAAPYQLRAEQRKIQEKHSAWSDSPPESSPMAAAGRFGIGAFGGIPALNDGVQEVVGSNPTAPTRMKSEGRFRSWRKGSAALFRWTHQRLTSGFRRSVWQRRPPEWYRTRSHYVTPAHSLSRA